jgi:hypothetical protein
LVLPIILDGDLKTTGIWKVALQNETGQETSAIFSRMDREAMQHDDGDNMMCVMYGRDKILALGEDWLTDVCFF